MPITTIEVSITSSPQRYAIMKWSELRQDLEPTIGRGEPIKYAQRVLELRRLFGILMKTAATARSMFCCDRFESSMTVLDGSSGPES